MLLINRYRQSQKMCEEKMQGSLLKYPPYKAFRVVTGRIIPPVSITMEVL
jgi:hypothetical protein